MKSFDEFALPQLRKSVANDLGKLDRELDAG
jgi:hypothetical protein